MLPFCGYSSENKAFHPFGKAVPSSNRGRVAGIGAGSRMKICSLDNIEAGVVVEHHKEDGTPGEVVALASEFLNVVKLERKE